MRCEEVFRQICWLEERFWPDVDGMGEEDESARLGTSSMGAISGGVGNLNGGISNDEQTPVGDARNSFAALNGGIESVEQGS